MQPSEIRGGRLFARKRMDQTQAFGNCGCTTGYNNLGHQYLASDFKGFKQYRLEPFHFDPFLRLAEQQKIKEYSVSDVISSSLSLSPYQSLKLKYSVTVSCCYGNSFS